MLRSAALAAASISALTFLALGVSPARAAASPVAGGGPGARRASSRPAASPELFQRFVDAEQHAVRIPAAVRDGVGMIPRPPTVGAAPPPLDAVDAKHDITLDPSTGVVTATLDLQVRASGRALGSVGLAFDKGLTVSAVSATGRSVTTQDQIYGDDRVLVVTFTTELPEGAETTVHVEYAGTLACTKESGTAACAKGRAFNYFAHGSIVPFIYDPTDNQNSAHDGLTRELVVKVPDTATVFVTGERDSESVAAGTRTTKWVMDRPIARHLGLYILAGQVGTKDVPGRTTPTKLVFQAPEIDADTRLMNWSAPVLDFIEETAGSPLPFQKSQTLVRLPKELGDPGTATFGMTLLSDLYVQSGELLHEETWCHENSHLFWGIVAPDMDPNKSRFLSEGLAVLTQIDFTHEAHFKDEDRDQYLARRYGAIGLDLRKNGGKVPAIVAPPNKPMSAFFGRFEWTLWAYYKTSATLDHLRATMGDAEFSKGLASYVSTCSFVGCTIDDFRAILEESSGQTLAPFFTRWVTGDERPEVQVAFTPTASGADVTLTKADTVPMRVELFVTLEDGTRVRTHADLGAAETTIQVGAPGPVRSVALNPRHDVRLASVSSVAGDLDFDGESDGLDVLRCARLVGSVYDGVGGSGLWTIDETFDPRCDLDGNFTIDDQDLAILAESYGTLRAR